MGGSLNTDPFIRVPHSFGVPTRDHDFENYPFSFRVEFIERVQ